MEKKLPDGWFVSATGVTQVAPAHIDTVTVTALTADEVLDRLIADGYALRGVSVDGQPPQVTIEVAPWTVLTGPTSQPLRPSRS